MEDYTKDKEFYRDEFVKLIYKIEDPGRMEYLYTFFKEMIEKWGY